jgi:CheY-like chemotaxis protein
MVASERVLVIEDDDDIREVMQEALVSEGYRVDVARDGLEALGQLEARTQPPVILLDMMMPRMDGEAFLKALRGRPALADAPVIVISGNAAAREKARQLAAAACLVKPFELDELLSVIRRLVRSAAPSVADRQA